MKYVSSKQKHDKENMVTIKIIEVATTRERNSYFAFSKLWLGVKDLRSF